MSYGEDTFVLGEDTSVYGEDILGRSWASASPFARALYQMKGPKTYWEGGYVGWGVARPWQILYGKELTLWLHTKGVAY